MREKILTIRRWNRKEDRVDFAYNDGGRQAAGYKGKTGDCVVRAVAIATGKPYQEVYNNLNILGEMERITRRHRHRSNARTGIGRKTLTKYMLSLGWKWTSTMFIGSGCRVHLRKEELPTGRLVVRVSKHVVAVIDGVIQDTYNCSRNGTRCVYGYYIMN